MAAKKEEMKKEYEKTYGLPYNDPTINKYEAFMKWMEGNGAKLNKLRMRYYGLDNRAVHTTQTISPDEMFLFVPEKIIINMEKGKHTPMGEKLAKSKVEFDWDYLVYITVFLMTQFHDPSSWWKPYMDVYPRDVSTFPMFYTPKEKELLRGSGVWEQIDEELKEIKDEYDTIVKAVPEFTMFSLDEYTKNKTLVISRIFYVTIHGKEDHIMVPMADMFNHYYERVGESFWSYDDKDEAFVVKALKTIKSGDPVPLP